MTIQTVSLQEVLTAARGRHASLVPESAGHLMLGIASRLGGMSLRVEPHQITLSTEGVVALASAPHHATTPEAVAGLATLFQTLLGVAQGTVPSLTAASEPRPDDDIPRLFHRIAKALIPLNRAAAKRALARLARETVRARDKGLVPPLPKPSPPALPASVEPLAPAPARRAPAPPPLPDAPAVGDVADGAEPRAVVAAPEDEHQHGAQEHAIGHESEHEIEIEQDLEHEHAIEQEIELDLTPGAPALRHVHRVAGVVGTRFDPELDRTPTPAPRAAERPSAVAAPHETEDEDLSVPPETSHTGVEPVAEARGETPTISVLPPAHEDACATAEPRPAPMTARVAPPPLPDPTPTPEPASRPSPRPEVAYIPAADVGALIERTLLGARVAQAGDATCAVEHDGLPARAETIELRAAEPDDAPDPHAAETPSPTFAGTPDAEPAPTGIVESAPTPMPPATIDLPAAGFVPRLDQVPLAVENVGQAFAVPIADTVRGAIDVALAAAVCLPIDETLEDNVEVPVEDNVDAPIEVSVDVPIEETIEPSLDAAVEPSLDSAVEPSLDAAVEPSLDAAVEPSLDAAVEPSLDAAVEPSLDAAAERSCDAAVHVSGEAGVRVSSEASADVPIEDTVDVHIEDPGEESLESDRDRSVAALAETHAEAGGEGVDHAPEPQDLAGLSSSISQPVPPRAPRFLPTPPPLPPSGRVEALLETFGRSSYGPGEDALSAAVSSLQRFVAGELTPTPAPAARLPAAAAPPPMPPLVDDGAREESGPHAASPPIDTDFQPEQSDVHLDYSPSPTSLSPLKDSIPPQALPNEPPPHRGSRWLGAVAALGALLTAGGVLWLRYPELASRALAAAGVQSRTTVSPEACLATLRLVDLPAPHEVLVRLGDAPLVRTPIPRGVTVELVATAPSHAPQRVWVAADARWEIADGTAMHTLELPLTPSDRVAMKWPASQPGRSGGDGPAGVLAVQRAPAGTELWLVAAVGDGHEATVRVRCDEPATVLAVNPDVPTERRRLQVEPELLQAAARAGGAELSILP